MGDSWKRVIAELGRRWAALGSGQKFITGALSIAVVLSLFLSIVLAKHATYSVLYAGLDAGGAGAVVEELRSMKIPFRLADSGRTILVPDKDVYTVRLDLAGEGLPGSEDSGYELFDGRGFGMTNFMQEVNYRRALEGELTRTIREMGEIIAARVHLVIPERSLFLDNGRQPSASVMLHLKPGVQLTRKQIEGISYLVSGSVEGMMPQSVNVLDHYGNLLSKGQRGDTADSQGLARLEVETSASRWLEEKAQTLLDRVVGPGKSVVRVTAELDFEQMERNVEIYDSENPVVRSEEVQEESGGEAGDESRNSVTNYEINKTVETLVRAPGSIQRLTVAVTVDGHYESSPGNAEDGGDLQFVPRTPEELEELAAVVKNAVGVDSRRGDQFHIGCVQFDQTHLQAAHEEMKRVERQILWQNLGKKGALVAGALIMLLILRKILRSIGRTFAQVAAAPVQEAASGAEGTLSGPPADIESLADQISDMARRRPQESASVIRNMIHEGD